MPRMCVDETAHFHFFSNVRTWSAERTSNGPQAERPAGASRLARNAEHLLDGSDLVGNGSAGDDAEHLVRSFDLAYEGGFVCAEVMLHELHSLDEATGCGSRGAIAAFLGAGVKVGILVALASNRSLARPHPRHLGSNRSKP